MIFVVSDMPCLSAPRVPPCGRRALVR
jgi:hypothetical protein